MSESTLIAQDRKLSRQEPAVVLTPQGTATHRPIPHQEVIAALTETLGFGHIGVHKDEYAVSRDGMKMFGIMELETQFNGCRFAIGIRNSHDKPMRLAMTVGYRVFICENMAFSGDFEPVLAKHSKRFSLQNALSIGVDSMQRNFKPMVEAVDLWRQTQLTDVTAKLLIYQAFIEGQLEAPRHLGRIVHDHYFEPQHEDFQPPDHLVAVKRLHLGVQTARPHPAVQSHRQTRGLPERFGANGQLVPLALTAPTRFRPESSVFISCKS
jgi:hypothetical protein